jgi:hypothetical protein
VDVATARGAGLGRAWKSAVRTPGAGWDVVSAPEAGAGQAHCRPVQRLGQSTVHGHVRHTTGFLGNQAVGELAADCEVKYLDVQGLAGDLVVNQMQGCAFNVGSRCAAGQFRSQGRQNVSELVPPVGLEPTLCGF